MKGYDQSSRRPHSTHELIFAGAQLHLRRREVAATTTSTSPTNNLLSSPFSLLPHSDVTLFSASHIHVNDQVPMAMILAYVHQI